ncbi:fibroblast growth factor receptor 1-like isoform X1 [Ptychodera flava]|uniref:fibroblast growth factor receptor 1-like isoform X1 n=1 Tax=Ptychodera flava TaxID=63121 RepID=UPI00396A5FE0
MLLMKISIMVAMAITMVRGDNSSSLARETVSEGTIMTTELDYYEEVEDIEEEERETELASQRIDGPSPPEWTKLDKMERDQYKVMSKWKSVNFRCAAKGNPIPKIEWLKDGVRLNETRRMGQKPRYKGYTLIMRDIVKSDSGRYMCIVSNLYGTLNFTYELIVGERVNNPPYIGGKVITNRTISEGDDVSLTCTVMAFTLSHHMQWFRQINQSLVDGRTPMETLQHAWPVHQPADWSCQRMVDELFGASVLECLTKSNVTGNQDVLYLRNVTTEQSGKYICWASNSLGVDYRTAWLTVKPITTEDPTSEPTLTAPMSPKFDYEYIIIAVIIVVLIVVVIVSLLLIRKYWSKPYRSGISQRRITPNPSIIRHQMSMESSSSVGSSHLLIRGQRLSSNITSISEIEIPYDENWEFPRNRMTLGKTLGEGAFGLVCEASAIGIMKKESNTTKTTCAVKMLKDDATERELNDLISEMEMMKQIGKHINIINLLGCCTQDGPLLVIVEYAPHGNLRDFLRCHRPQTADYENAELLPKIDLLTNKDLVSFAYQIARGMSFLSLNKCVHRDLAARNVLVGKDHIMKIADFGLARDVHYIDYYRKNTNGRVPVKWMSPEALFDRVYTIQSDVWSFGILLWEIMTLGGSPYPSLPVEMLFDFLKAGKRMEQPHGCSPEVYFVMRDCWRTSPNQRPNFNQLVQTLDGLLTQSSNQDYLSLDALGDGPEVMTEYLDSSTVESNSSDSTKRSSQGNQSLPNKPRNRLESTV